MNLFQALGLATLFPAAALFAPWWALVGVMWFYLADAFWTHRLKEIPGLSSAVAGFLSVAVAIWIAEPADPGASGVVLVAVAVVAGLLTLAAPWLMAYRSVRRA